MRLIRSILDPVSRYSLPDRSARMVLCDGRRDQAKGSLPFLLNESLQIPSQSSFLQCYPNLHGSDQQKCKVDSVITILPRWSELQFFIGCPTVMSL